MIELAVNETNYRYFMIEAIAEVGCGYELVCPLRPECARNKDEVVVARVPEAEAATLENLVETWAVKPEEPCQLKGNYLNGGVVEIQHFRVFETRQV